MMLTRLNAALTLIAAFVFVFATSVSAQDNQCWVSYDDFEEMVPHSDLIVCPGTEVSAEEGFCRLGLTEDTITIYVFEYGEDDNICLTEGRGYDITNFIQRFGNRYAVPR